MTDLSEEWRGVVKKIDRLLILARLSDEDRLVYFLSYLLLKKELSAQNSSLPASEPITWRDVLTATLDHPDEAGKKLDRAFSLLVHEKFKSNADAFDSPILPANQTNKIIKTLSGFPNDDDDLIGKIADFVIRNGSFLTKKGGSNLIPQYISQLIAGLAISGPATKICDVNCADGTTLIECARRSEVEKCRQPDFLGISQNASEAKVCLLNLALHNIPISHVRIGNGNLDDFQEEIKTCDRIIGVYPPSFAAPSSRKHPKDSIIDIVNLLPTGGMGALIVPARMLAGEQNASARTVWVNNDTIEAIIRLPTPIFPGSGIDTYLITLNPEKLQSTKNKILFVDIADYLRHKKAPLLDLSDLDEIFKKYRDFTYGMPDQNNRLLDRFSRVVSTECIKKSNYVLTIQRYICPDVDRIDIESCFQDLQIIEKKRRDLEEALDTDLKDIIGKLKK